MSTAILIHGCHLQANGWEDVVWGNPEIGRMGRIPTALRLLKSEKAGLLIWGTGASEKDGLKESEYTFRFAVAHAGSLPEFAGLDPYEIQTMLLRVSVIDSSTQNTTQEIEGAAAACKERGINRLILVSSPTHISRCLLEAEKLRAAGKLSGLEVFATASDTCYAGSVPGDVVIVEPPHRGDRPQIPIHRAAARVNKLGRGEGAAEFEQALSRFLKDWET